jgi:hypothetical protein
MDLLARRREGGEPMKLKLLTSASILGNLLLLMLLWSGRHRGERSALPSAGETPDSVPVVVAPKVDPAPAPSPSGPALPVWPPFRWEEVVSADYTNYVANLRRIGCPETTVADIIKGATWTDLMRRIYDGAVPQHDLIYQVLSGGEEGLKKVEAAFEPVKEEQAKRDQLLAAVLGSVSSVKDVPLEKVRSQAVRDFGYVDPERRELLAILTLDHQTKVSQFMATNSGAAFRKMRDHFDADLRAAQMEALSEAERHEFDLREWKKKNGQEFSALAIVAESPEELRGYAGLSPDQLTQALGPAKAADLERIADRVSMPNAYYQKPPVEDRTRWVVRSDFRDLRAVTRRFGLSEEQPRAALDVIRSYEPTLKTVGQDGGLLPRERRELLRALVAERDAKIEGILGKEAWETYQFHFGDW